MLININQIRTNGKNLFQVYINNYLTYYAETPWFDVKLPLGIENSRVLKFMDNNGQLVYRTKYNILENTLETAVPLKYLFTGEQRFMQMSILNQYNQICGSIYNKVNGLIDTKLCFSFNNELFIGHDVCSGKIRTISVFKGDLQVAQVTKPLSVKNNLDSYCIHLLDDYAYIADVISFFVIYFDYLYYRNSGQIVKEKTSFQMEYTYSKSNKFYNKFWIKEHFGDEEHARYTQMIEQNYIEGKKEFNRILSILKIVGLIVLGYVFILAFILIKSN